MPTAAQSRYGTAQDQIASSAYAVSDKQCENLICALTLATHLMKDNQLGAVATNVGEGMKHTIIVFSCNEQLQTIQELQSPWEMWPGTRVRVTLSLQSSTCRRVQVLACLVEGDEVRTLRSDACGTQKLLV